MAAYCWSNFYNFKCFNDYLIAGCFVWVWNLVADIAGGKEAEGVWEYGVEDLGGTR